MYTENVKFYQDCDAGKQVCLKKIPVNSRKSLLEPLFPTCLIDFLCVYLWRGQAHTLQKTFTCLINN